MNRSQIFFSYGVLPALFLNFIGSYFYFILFADSGFANVLYGSMKGILLVWPFIWLVYIQKLPKFTSQKKILQSLLFGLMTGVGITFAGLFVFFLAEDYFRTFTPLILQKVVQMGVLEHYILFAAVICTLHSLFEEFFWRCFVFRGLLLQLAVVPAAIASSIGFSLHHFVILSQYFPPVTTLLLGIAVFVGGMIWCLIYAKTNSILGSWLSHFFIDMGIFYIGYVMLFS